MKTDKDDFTDFAGLKVAVLGLGLMGGSLAMALRGQAAELLGIDPDPATLALARRLHLADRLASDPAGLLPEADVVILASPIRAILRTLADLPHLHPGSPVVIDLGSTKGQILAAMAELPPRFDPLGGHPMCGKEHASLTNAEAGLYAGATFALCPLERTSRRARHLGERLAQLLGANPLWLPAGEHDRQVAATSHLPFLAANSLAVLTPPDAAALAGPGFRSSTRLAPQPAEMMLDILQTNAINILPALAALRGRLENLENLIRHGDWPALQQRFIEGAQAYARLTAEREAP